MKTTRFSSLVGRFDGGVGVVVAGDVGPVLEGFLGGGEFGGELVAVAGVTVVAFVLGVCCAEW